VEMSHPSFQQLLGSETLTYYVGETTKAWFGKQAFDSFLCVTRLIAVNAQTDAEGLVADTIAALRGGERVDWRGSRRQSAMMRRAIDAVVAVFPDVSQWDARDSSGFAVHWGSTA
jgi:hypothetical protein